MERRLAAILAADVAGYGRLMGASEERTLAALRGHRAAVIDPEIIRRSGRVFKTMGDGLLAAFPSVVAAVECAMAIQRGVAARNQGVPPRERLEFRIGVNLDEVVVEGDDLLGDGVNIAARLQALADTGAVCVSEGVLNHIRNRVDAAFEDLGPQRLKNIAEPVRAFRCRPAPAGSAAEALSAGAELPVPVRPSIAILPFTHLGNSKDAYWADGLRLDLQAALVHASGLFLVAPAAVDRYRGSGNPAEQAARELGVRYVLEGAARRSRRRLRLSLALTDSVARQIVWAERYDRTLADGFDLGDEIVAEVLKALDVRLASGERWLLHGSFDRLEDLDLFYRGLSAFYAGSKEGNATARDLFGELSRRRPHSPIGPAYLCFTHWADAFKGWAESKERSLAEAARCAERAAGEHGSNGLPEIVLASRCLLERRHDQALALCREAVQRRPNCPTANGYLANILLYCGRPVEAIAGVREAMRISPVYPAWYVALLAAAYCDLGELEQAIATGEEAVRLAPGDRDARVVLCSAYELAHRNERAREVAREILALHPTFTVARCVADQPYRDRATLARLAASLRQAGLPG